MGHTPVAVRHSQLSTCEWFLNGDQGPCDIDKHFVGVYENALLQTRSRLSSIPCGGWMFSSRLGGLHRSALSAERGLAHEKLGAKFVV